jgi:hypothetical protein
LLRADERLRDALFFTAERFTAERFTADRFTAFFTAERFTERFTAFVATVRFTAFLAAERFTVFFTAFLAAERFTAFLAALRLAGLRFAVPKIASKMPALFCLEAFFALDFLRAAIESLLIDKGPYDNYLYIV